MLGLASKVCAEGFAAASVPDKVPDKVPDCHQSAGTAGGG